MQPAEVFELEAGEQDRWNRTCELVAWAVWQVVMSIPSFSRNPAKEEWRRFDRFLEQQAPPGYRPEPKGRK